jgi:hypothetical protein
MVLERVLDTEWTQNFEVMNPLFVDAPGEMLRDVQLTLDAGPIDDKLRAFVWKACPLPGFNPFPHRLEVSLHAVHSNREDVHGAQVLRVLGEHGPERP